MTNGCEVARSKRAIGPPMMFWAPFAGSRKVPVFLNERMEVVRHFTLYACYRAGEYRRGDESSEEVSQGYLSMMREVAYTLKAFSGYLSSSRTKWTEVADDVLLALKKHLFAEVRRKASSRSKDTAQNTVNRKLKIVYDFYWWAQEQALFVSGHVGNTNQEPIRSAIVEYKRNPVPFERSPSMMKTVYPLLTSGVATRSRSRRQHYATQAEIAQAKAHYRENSKTGTAERNVLIVDIIDAESWRRGSVRSLDVEQFSRDKIDKALANGEKFLSVTPSLQKMGHTFPFDVPIQLAIRILRFVRGPRASALRALGLEKYLECGPLFISHTTGKRLSLGHITEIVGTPLKACGAGKGAGPHSIRRKSGREKATEIMQIRRQRGMSMDPTDIRMDLKGFLGQSSMAAQDAYTAGKRDIYSESREQDLRNQLIESQGNESELRAALAASQAENEKLRKASSQRK